MDGLNEMKESAALQRTAGETKDRVLLEEPIIFSFLILYPFLLPFKIQNIRFL